MDSTPISRSPSWAEFLRRDRADVILAAEFVEPSLIGFPAAFRVANCFLHLHWIYLSMFANVSKMKGQVMVSIKGIIARRRNIVLRLLVIWNDSARFESSDQGFQLEPCEQRNHGRGSCSEAAFLIHRDPT